MIKGNISAPEAIFYEESKETSLGSTPQTPVIDSYFD
jgi:hypothetical protein